MPAEIQILIKFPQPNPEAVNPQPYKPRIETCPSQGHDKPCKRTMTPHSQKRTHAHTRTPVCVCVPFQRPRWNL